MNPYSFSSSVHSEQSKNARPTAHRIALATLVAVISHLMLFACWMTYDAVFEQTGGCFTGDGLLELLVLGLSFATFSVVSIIAAIKVRKWRIVVAATCCFAPVIFFLIAVLVRFFL